MHESGRTIQQAEQLVRQGRIADAKPMLERILSREPDNERVLGNLARIAHTEKDAARATEILDRLLAMEPEKGVYHYQRGVIEMERGDMEAALGFFSRAAELDRDQPVVLLHQAMVLERLGRRYDAAMLYRKVWLKLLRGGRDLNSLPPPLQQLVTRGNAVVKEEMKAVFNAILDDVRERFHGEDLSRLERMAAVLRGDENPPERGPLQSQAGIHFPGLEQTPFLDRTLFPWLEEIEAQAEAIRAEYLALATEEKLFHPYVSIDEQSPSARHWEAVNNSTAWNSCHIYHYGTLQEDVASRCPVTVATLDRAPLVRVPAHGPESIFSVLKPKTHIPPHHGLVSGRLLVHLPLIVPENCGALRVGGEARSWEVGRCIVFDDTFAHEAWNDSSETRVVLIFDIWHPALSNAERSGFATMMETLDRINFDSLGKAMLRE